MQFKVLQFLIIFSKFWIYVSQFKKKKYFWILSLHFAFFIYINYKINVSNSNFIFSSFFCGVKKKNHKKK